MIRQGQGLIDRLNPGRAGIIGIVELQRRAIHPDFARIGDHRTGQNAHETGLSRAIVT